jgi:DNA-binding response OmpR family regulator
MKGGRSDSPALVPSACPPGRRAIDCSQVETMRLLLVEDEPTLSHYLKQGLEEEGHAVDAVVNGRDALDWSRTTSYDVIVLDIMIPLIDGIEVCRKIRSRRQETPIIMLTARDSVRDRIAGLDAGADDYLIKPFAFEELLARVRALSRRSIDTRKSPILEVADLSLNTVTKKTTRGGIAIELPAKEHAVLEVLMRHPEQVFTRSQIAEHVWDFHSFNESNVVDVYIRNLRRKIDDPFPRKLIQTVRGTGYRISGGDGTRNP